MANVAIAIHGGAGSDNDFIRKHLYEYEDSLARICKTGYKMLKKGASSTDVLFEVLKNLEDDPLYNAGRGSALNEHGKAQMDAAVMEGKSLRTGAVAILERVKNPSAFVKEVMKDTHHVFLGGNDAQELAFRKNLQEMPASYFVTDHQVDLYLEKNSGESVLDMLKKKMHGTVGVVVADKNKNIAAGTSSGGTENSMAGRIGDSCVIGGGCYANNNTCAVSGTGDGEYLIQGVIAHSVASYLEYIPEATVQEACDYVIFQKNKKIEGDIGVIAVDHYGSIGISFNCERMHRAWIGTDGELYVRNYIDS